MRDDAAVMNRANPTTIRIAQQMRASGDSIRYIREMTGLSSATILKHCQRISRSDGVRRYHTLRREAANPPRCLAVDVSRMGHVRRCPYPQYRDVSDPWVRSEFCVDHLERDCDSGEVIPVSHADPPEGVELLAAVARGFRWRDQSKSERSGKERDGD